jgi:hypothetical protein
MSMGTVRGGPWVRAAPGEPMSPDTMASHKAARRVLASTGEQPETAQVRLQRGDGVPRQYS